MATASPGRRCARSRSSLEGVYSAGALPLSLCASQGSFIAAMVAYYLARAATLEGQRSHCGRFMSVRKTCRRSRGAARVFAALWLTATLALPLLPALQPAGAAAEGIEGQCGAGLAPASPAAPA